LTVKSPLLEMCSVNPSGFKKPSPLDGVRIEIAMVNYILCLFYYPIVNAVKLVTAS